jgi:anionic cell wall polymer biosynthesis LytR-Cps2A-Psr (LCP) family protein
MEQILEKILEKIREGFSYQAYEDLYFMCRETMKTDIPLAVRYLKTLSALCESAIRDEDLSEEDFIKFPLYKEIPLCYNINLIPIPKT